MSAHIMGLYEPKSVKYKSKIGETAVVYRPALVKTAKGDYLLPSLECNLAEGSRK
jgi:hypothetical protein